MNVWNDLNNLPNFKNAVVTIGSFDGVHSGHQKIIQKINKLAENIGGESIVVTFHPHPREIIYPKDNSLRLITTINEKTALFERYGVDHVIVVPFTIEFSQQKADEYIEKFLYEKFNPKYVVIGYDHRFGLNRQGDINFLKWHGKQYGFEVVEIQKQEIEHIAISSTKIRTAIGTGEIKTASKLLGHNFVLTGRVVRGQQFGSKIEFPTANLEVPQKNKLIPGDGIYSVYVHHKTERYGGMLYIGDRPTLTEFNNKTIEVNIFDFNKDLYGDNLRIEFLEKIREDEKFDDLEGLKNQLKKDKISALSLIEQYENEGEVLEAEKKPFVSVVILNWNGQELLRQFLPSVLDADYPNFEVVVADNDSSDDSVKILKREFPEVKIIRLNENYGFAGGYNRALEKVDADYYVLLNSDVEVSENWLSPMIELMEKDKTIGAAQPKILAQKNKTLFEYAGACGGWMDYLGYPFCRGRILSTVEKDVGQYDTNQEIFWASGAALFIRPRLFHGLGGFDESFFAHMEEIDLCWRIKRAGFKIMACPKSVVYHVGGSTLNYLSPRKTFLNFRNSYFTLVKNENSKKLTWLIPLRLCLDGLAGGLFLIQGKFKHIISIIKAHWAFYPKYRSLRKNRAYYQDMIDKISISSEPNQTGIYPKSILFQYFIKGKKYFRQLDEL